MAAFSGPSYASEVSEHIPTAIILASKDEKLLEDVSEILMNEYMRIYKSKRCNRSRSRRSSKKNIIALLYRACVELGFGTNALAALITRGLAEISRLGIKMGADKETFFWIIWLRRFNSYMLK